MYNAIIFYVFGTLMIFISFIPVFIYLKYGREPKIDYDANYERELPFDDPPAIVNAICNSSLENVGEPNLNGYIATILDLIDRKYLILNSENNGKKESNLISIDYDKDFDDLWDFEKEIINFLSEYETNGVIDMRYLSLPSQVNAFQDLNKNWEEKYSSREEMVYDYLNEVDRQRPYDKIAFQDFYKNWKENIKYSLWNDGNLKEFFSKKGDKYLKIFGIAGIISSISIVYFIFDYVAILYVFFLVLLYIFAAFFMYILSLKPDYRIEAIICFIITFSAVFYVLWPIYSYNQNLDFSANFFIISTIPLGFSLIASLVVPQKIFDHWSPYGKEYYERWMSFKRYISDYSLIKEYPPESVQLWNKYLVYATALGYAKGVRKAMENSLPTGELEGNDIYGLQKYDTFDNVMKDALRTAFDRG